jgi:hypothetical protein
MQRRRREVPNMLVERGLALLFFFGSAAYLFGATGLAMGTLSAPKAGFLPTVVGVLALVLSGLDLARTLYRSSASPQETDYAKALGFAAILAGYIVALSFVGFLASTIVCTFLLLKIAGVRGSVVPAGLSVGLAAAIQVGFGMLLNLQLP